MWVQTLPVEMVQQRLEPATGQSTWGYQPHGDDVVMIVKDRMASLVVSQIILGRIHGMSLQPRGRR